MVQRMGRGGQLVSACIPTVESNRNKGNPKVRGLNKCKGESCHFLRSSLGRSIKGSVWDILHSGRPARGSGVWLGRHQHIKNLKAGRRWNR